MIQITDFCRILAENFEHFVMKENVKKRLVASYNNLSPELQEQVRALYPLGFADAMMRVDKPNGDFFYAVPFETDEVSYLVKIDVKIDDGGDDDDDKEYYDDDIKGVEDLQDDGAQADDKMADDDIDI